MYLEKEKYPSSWWALPLIVWQRFIPSSYIWLMKYELLKKKFRSQAANNFFKKIKIKGVWLSMSSDRGIGSRDMGFKSTHMNEGWVNFHWFKNQNLKLWFTGAKQWINKEAN